MRITPTALSFLYALAQNCPLRLCGNSVLCTQTWKACRLHLMRSWTHTCFVYQHGRPHLQQQAAAIWYRSASLAEMAAATAMVATPLATKPAAARGTNQKANICTVIAATFLTVRRVPL